MDGTSSEKEREEKGPEKPAKGKKPPPKDPESGEENGGVTRLPRLGTRRSKKKDSK